MNRYSANNRPALTRVEVLVIIVICTIAVGVVLPANQKVREASTRAKTHNNLKWMGLAFNNFDGAFNLLPHSQGFSSGKNTRPAQFHILPYMENEAYYSAFLTQSASTATITGFMDPSRGGPGFISTNGATVDYAVNSAIFGDINPTNYSVINLNQGTPMGVSIPTRHPIVTNCTTYSISTLTSNGRGTSNTIFAGQKRMATGNYESRNTDMGINETPTTTEKASGGGGRGSAHARVSNYLARDPDGTANVNGDWGGPYANGCVFLFGDGHTATIRYSASTSGVMTDVMNPVSTGTMPPDELGPGKDEEPSDSGTSSDETKAKSSNILVIIIGGVVVVLLLAIGIGGVIVYRYKTSKNKD